MNTIREERKNEIIRHVNDLVDSCEELKETPSYWSDFASDLNLGYGGNVVPDNERAFINKHLGLNSGDGV